MSGPDAPGYVVIYAAALSGVAAKKETKRVDAHGAVAVIYDSPPEPM
jgi:hypothetical protein